MSAEGGSLAAALAVAAAALVVAAAALVVAAAPAVAAASPVALSPVFALVALLAAAALPLTVVLGALASAAVFFVVAAALAALAVALAVLLAAVLAAVLAAALVLRPLPPAAVVAAAVGCFSLDLRGTVCTVGCFRLRYFVLALYANGLPSLRAVFVQRALCFLLKALCRLASREYFRPCVGYFDRRSFLP
ncbi:MAG: hypothetical protein GY737_32125 [Desulfobacteraceae bacterium]|nr:hypothetical protein [Desulfobacteraceae bacterium]